MVRPNFHANSLHNREIQLKFKISIHNFCQKADVIKNEIPNLNIYLSKCIDVFIFFGISLDWTQIIRLNNITQKL